MTTFEERRTHQILADALRSVEIQLYVLRDEALELSDLAVQLRERVHQLRDDLRPLSAREPSGERPPWGAFTE